LRPVVVSGEGDWKGALQGTGKSIRELHDNMKNYDTRRFLDKLFDKQEGS
jgi:hypothetical protein